MRNKATQERLRQTYPTSLCVVLTWFWCFGDGQHAQFNPTAAMMHQGVHFCLLGVSSLRVSVSPVSFSGCSYVPARSFCLLRLTAAGASRCSCTTRPPVETERPWWALMRSPSLQPSSAHPPLTTKTCPRVIEYVDSRAYKYRYVCVCVCVRDCAQARMSVLLWKNESSSSTTGVSSSLLPHSTADCCGRHALINTALLHAF